MLGTALIATIGVLGVSPSDRPFTVPPQPAALPAVAQPALDLAQKVWHPTCGKLSISSEHPPASLPDTGESIGGWAWPGDCTIRVRIDKKWLGGPELCETVLHEAGHVAGRLHSDKPESIMYPLQNVMRGRSRVEGSKRSVITWGGVDKRCLRAYHAHG